MYVRISSMDPPATRPTIWVLPPIALLTAGRESALVTGFSYRPGTLPECTGNLGLRVAEGVEGKLRVLWADRVEPLAFEPGYWLLEPGKEGYHVVPIRDQELMVLIVFLCEIGNGNPALYERAVEHLWQ